jgi:hypothetical protein
MIFSTFVGFRATPGDSKDSRPRSGPQLPRERFTGLIGIGEHRVKAVATLEVPSSALLLGMAADQSGVHVDRQQLRCARELPHTRPRHGVSGAQPLEPVRSLAIRSITRNAVAADATGPNNAA